MTESLPDLGDIFPLVPPEVIHLPGEETPPRQVPWGNGEFNVTVTPYADWLWGTGVWETGVLIRLAHAATPVGPGEKP